MQGTGDFLGLPTGKFQRGRFPGRRAVGTWGAVQCPGRVAGGGRVGGGKGPPVIGRVAPLHPPETPDSLILRSLGPSQEREIFLFPVKKLQFSFSLYPSDYV